MALSMHLKTGYFVHYNTQNKEILCTLCYQFSNSIVIISNILMEIVYISWSERKSFYYL